MTPESATFHGAPAVFDTAGAFRLIHLDNPDADTRARRIGMVSDGSYFVDDCPVCREQKERGGDVVFEAEEEWDEIADEPPDLPEPIPSGLWTRTYIDAGAPYANAREEIHALCAGVAFCGLELIDDLAGTENPERWTGSLSYFAKGFARFAPALAGVDRLDQVESRNLGGLCFQVRSFLGWFGEGAPTLATKCADLDRTCARLVDALKRFEDEETSKAG